MAGPFMAIILIRESIHKNSQRILEYLFPLAKSHRRPLLKRPPDTKSSVGLAFPV
jgi:hypothetical protein